MSAFKEQIKTQVEKSQAKLKQVLVENNVEEKVSVLKEKTIDSIKKYPIPSLIAGLAIGFILGKLVSKSSKDE